jgi:hypothetical protein
MTRLAPPKRWMFTRDTRLESGEHQIDGYDAEGFPIRLCSTEQPTPGHARVHRRQ